MQVKKAVVWFLVRNQRHPTLQADDYKIETLMPVIEAMFPGIAYYSITGFNEALQRLVVPALRVRHPMQRVSARDITAADMVEVAEVLPSRGSEWQTDPNWTVRFRRLIST